MPDIAGKRLSCHFWIWMVKHRRKRHLLHKSCHNAFGHSSQLWTVLQEDTSGAKPLGNLGHRLLNSKEYKLNFLVRKQTSFYAFIQHVVLRWYGWFLVCHTWKKQLWGFQPFLVHTEECLHVDCCDMTKGLPTDLLWQWKEKGFLLANDMISIHFSANIHH